MFAGIVYDTVGEHIMICKNCNQEKLDTEFYWNSSKSRFETTCKTCMKDRRKRRYKQDASKEKQQHYKYVEQNRESVNAYKKQWARDHKSQRTEYARKKYQTDIVWRIKSCLRSRITAAVSKKHGDTMNLVGCDIQSLCNHLESLFEEGMNWDNYGDWHIDHIKPCAAFDLSQPDQQKKCFHYSNLQPLWAEDNLRKASRG